MTAGQLALGDGCRRPRADNGRRACPRGILSVGRVRVPAAQGGSRGGSPCAGRRPWSAPCGDDLEGAAGHTVPSAIEVHGVPSRDRHGSRQALRLLPRRGVRHGSADSRDHLSDPLHPARRGPARSRSRLWPVDPEQGASRALRQRRSALLHGDPRYGRTGPVAGQTAVHLASGGHPPAVVLRADGTVGFLPTPGGLLVAVLPSASFATATTAATRATPSCSTPDNTLGYADSIPSRPIGSMGCRVASALDVEAPLASRPRSTFCCRWPGQQCEGEHHAARDGAVQPRALVGDGAWAGGDESCAAGKQS